MDAVERNGWCGEMSGWQKPTWEELMECTPPHWEEGPDYFMYREPCRLPKGHGGAHDWVLV